MREKRAAPTLVKGQPSLLFGYAPTVILSSSELLRGSEE